MSKAPAFQFYAGDYLASSRVQLMTLEEEGAYIRLLCHCWIAGSIPKDPAQIARLVGKGCSTTLASKLATMFTVKGDSLTSDKMEEIRQARQEWIDKCKKGGRASAESRKTLKNNTEQVKGSTKGSTKGSSTKTPSRVVDDYLQLNGNTSSSTSSSNSLNNLGEIPSKQEVLNYAAQIGLVEWRAEDWWLDMEAKGWKSKGDEVVNWQAFLTRVKTWWEADGRPMERTRNNKTKDSSKPSMPLWKRIEVIRQEMETHEGNSESTYYKQGNPKAKEEFRELKITLKALLNEEKQEALR